MVKPILLLCRSPLGYGGSWEKFTSNMLYPTINTFGFPELSLFGELSTPLP
jgi:hypothetical protein